VIRAESLDADFGRGGSDDYAKDEIEKEVIKKGVENIELEGEFSSWSISIHRENQLYGEKLSQLP